MLYEWFLVRIIVLKTFLFDNDIRIWFWPAFSYSIYNFNFYRIYFLLLWSANQIVSRILRSESKTFFNKYYVTLVLDFKTEKKSLIEPIINLFSFSTSQNWQMFVKKNWRKHVVSRSIILLTRSSNQFRNYESWIFTNFSTSWFVFNEKNNNKWINKTCSDWSKILENSDC